MNACTAPMSGIKKRTRNKAPKSRLGCSRCKDRRVKCDETHPECENCIKVGYQCPGFQRIFRWSTKYERAQKTSPVETPGDQATGVGSVPPTEQEGEGAQCSSVNNETYIASSSSALYNQLDDLALDLDFAWLPRISTPMQTTILDSDVFPGATDTWNTDSANRRSHFLEAQCIANFTEVLPAPTHLPTALVEHWFCRVCPMWSAFDSKTSYNRQLAWESWGTSEAVFYTIQAMSAACLSASTPQLQRTESSLRTHAVAAIDKALRLVRGSRSPTVTSDVVYAIFTLGNSWDRSTTTIPQYPWLESARELLSIWETHLAPSDAMLHAYFLQALNYWEMLLATVGRGTVPLRLQSRRRQYHVRLCQGLQLSDFNANFIPSAAFPDRSTSIIPGTRPNSWSGISNEVIEIFGQVLALCFNASRYSKNTGNSAASMASEVLCDLAIAHDLKRQLLAMNFETLVHMEEAQGFRVQTGDENTPVGHLLQTAEAYRQAALLQLHLAFSDLTMEPRESCRSFVRTAPAEGTEDTSESSQVRKESLLALTLDLVTILGQIPSQSGSRSIHLMLYLCAATGLRFDPLFRNGGIPGPNEGAHSLSASSDLVWNLSTSETNLLLHGLPNVASPPAIDDHTLVRDDTADTPISRSTLEVFKSRDLILTRLSSFQQTLPHRRMEETIQFVRNIWIQYDNQGWGSCSLAQWLNILAQSGVVVSLW